MRKRSVLMCLAASMTVLFALGTGLANAQAAAAADKPVTLESLLKAAGAPLTAEQAKKVKELDVTKGREAFQGLNDMFTEPQMAALKKELGTRPGRNNGPETPRFLMQVAALKALPADQSSYRQMNDILTDKQKEEMQKVFPRRQ